MKKRKFNFSSFPLLLVLAMIVGFSSCKSKKKTTEVSDTDKARTEIEAEIADAEEDEEMASSEETASSQRLQNYFRAIANAPSLQSANGSISETLTMFSSPDVPVLIVIYKEGGITDYDEPTTIKKYLEYLKDTKKNMATVEEMVLDNNGKIAELVLRK